MNGKTVYINSSGRSCDANFSRDIRFEKDPLARQSTPRWLTFFIYESFILQISFVKRFIFLRKHAVAPRMARDTNKTNLEERLQRNVENFKV